MSSNQDMVYRAARNGFALGFLFRAPVAVFQSRKELRSILPVFRASLKAGTILSVAAASYRICEWAFKKSKPPANAHLSLWEKFKRIRDNLPHVLDDLWDSIIYNVDLYLAGSPYARFLLLGGISVSLVSGCAALAKVVITDEQEFTFGEALWWAFVRTIDTGKFGDEESAARRVVAALTSFVGVMVVASLIGLVSGTLEEKFEMLRKGKGTIRDKRHMLLLGWQEERALHVLRELSRNYQSNGGYMDEKQKSTANIVVILSSTATEEVEETISEHKDEFPDLRVVVREGSVHSVSDLQKAAAHNARAIIFLGRSAQPEKDVETIKILLALRLLKSKGALVKNHAVLELANSKRRDICEQLSAGGVSVVVMSETLPRILVQTARQPGLADVYNDILSYDGSELHFKEFPQLVGVSFAELQCRVQDAVVCGLQRAGGKKQKSLMPPSDQKVQPGDQILILANHAGSASVCAPRSIPALPLSPPPSRRVHQRQETFLVCGKSSHLPFLLSQFDAYEAKGSLVLLLNDMSADKVNSMLTEISATNLKVEHIPGDPTLPAAVRNALNRAVSPKCVIVLADDSLNTEEADAKTIMTALLLSDLGTELMDDGERPRIICELMNSDSQELLERSVCEFVLSNEITSRLITQIAEQRFLGPVFDELFAPEGVEVYLKAVQIHIPLHFELSWLAVQAAVSRKNEIALGYALLNQKAVLNPPQDQVVKFSNGDRLVVIAENDSELEQQHENQA